MERIRWEGKDVFPVKGMVSAQGQQLYGVFQSAGDARSLYADERAIAIVGSEALTEAQRAIAQKNADARDLVE